MTTKNSQTIFQDKWLFVTIADKPFVRSLQTANLYPIDDNVVLDNLKTSN